MKLNPYLNFKGECREAFTFYEKTFKGTMVLMMPFEGSPAEGEASAEWGGKILHARLMVGEVALMGGDEMPEDYVAPQGFNVTLNINTPAEAERVFAALAEGGQVRLALRETFWASRYGMVTDRFGIPWMINCETANA